MTLLVGQFSSCSEESEQIVQAPSGANAPTDNTRPISDGPTTPDQPRGPGQDDPDNRTEPLPDDDISPGPTLPEISGLRWYPNTWQDKWSKAMMSYLDEIALIDLPVNESDLRQVNCSGHRQATREERKHFWIVFMASISSQESAFNPKTRYYERALGEWSEGLFQLSVSNRKPKGGCSLINKQTILRPLPNIYCALVIMENQVRGSRRYHRPTGVLFPTRPYYWSVLTRMPAKGRVIEFFKRHIDDLPFCTK
jgi:hypothetical protein